MAASMVIYSLNSFRVGSEPETVGDQKPCPAAPKKGVSYNKMCSELSLHVS